MKKSIAILALLLLASLLLSSCGGSSKKPEWEIGQYGKTSGSAAGTEAPGGSGTQASGNVQTNNDANHTIFPLPESEGKDGFTFPFDIIAKDGSLSKDASMVKVHIKIVNSKNETVFDEDVPVTHGEGSETIMQAFVDYSKVTPSVNIGTATVTVSGKDLAVTGDLSFQLRKLPMNLDSEVEIAEKRTANRYTSKGEIETTTTIEKIERQDTSLSSGVTMTFTFSCRRTVGTYDYCGFTVIFSDKAGNELGRKKCFTKVEADGTFQCTATLNKYQAGTGLVVSFADYE